MRSPHISLINALVATLNKPQVPSAAGLAGPAFVPPTKFRGSDALKSAANDFEEYVRGSTAIQSNDTAWAVAVFSTHDDEPLYEKYFTPDYDIETPEVNIDSVFRLASVSKVFSVWTFLNEVGDDHYHEPITRYVPELIIKTNKSTDVLSDDIDLVRWEDVTLGQLASQLAGIPRDPAQNDLSAQLPSEAAAAFGLPTIDMSDLPQCGVVGLQRSCTQSIAQLLKQHPIFPTAYSPAYSNVAYALLGLAQEAITGVPVNEAINKGIFAALNMTSSSYNTPPKSGGVIPGNASIVGWDWDMGMMNPSGSLYSSTRDMIKAGQAILGSKTMAPAQTRRWLKSMSQTGVLGSAVGAPWEIRHLLVKNRLTQLYTKQGDTGGYRSAFVLSPEHQLGAIVFAAGSLESNSAAVREELMNSVGSVFLPAVEEQARVEARQNFAGTFTDPNTNSSVTIDVDNESSGLVVKSLFSRGVQVVGDESPFIPLFNAGQSARLFPSALRTVKKKLNGKGSFDSRLGFRAVFFNATGDANAVQDPGLMQWTALGAPTYGGNSLDDWVFEMAEDGKAKAVDVRMMKVKLQRP
ncbi:beta-lactamase/transpeptidase-like protein [Sarocladium strictum]